MQQVWVQRMATAALLAFLSAGCGYDNTEQNVVGADRLLSVSPQPIVDIDAATMRTLLGDKVGPTDPLFGIRAYTVRYRTTDEAGNEINASGLMSVPVPSEAFLQAKPDFTMSIVSDQHGTIFSDAEAPTTQAKTTHQPNPIAIAYTAMAGFITLQPDYIGFGASKGFHPFLLERSSAHSVVDLIEASIKFSDQAGLPLNGQIFLSGYSEGGVATLDAAKEIQLHHPELSLKGVAPMEGPYDLNLTFSGVLSSLLDQNDSNDDFPFPLNAFGGDIVNAFAKSYDIPLDSMVQAPLSTTLPTLFNGSHTDAQLAAALPTDKKEFFQLPFVINYFTDPHNRLKEAALENTPLDWHPKMPMHLYHCKGDTTVPIQIAQLSAAKLGLGADAVVQLDSDTHPLGHRECAVPAYRAAVQWFNALRSGE